MNSQHLYGSTQPYPTPTPLRAGPLRMSYENGFLRHLHHDGEEVLRMIYFALRDENWGTYAPHFSDETLDLQPDSFRISYQCHHKNREDQPVFRWNVTIAGDADGTITFEIEGETRQPILRNRAGFCILHPPKSCAGQLVNLFHENRETETTTFPQEIAPGNPFLNLSGMSWQSANGGWYALDFEGDAFETEDQRNWTDASFKTFCTPLSLPRPVQLNPGDRVQQRVQFGLDIAQPLPGSATTDERVPVRVSLPEELETLNLAILEKTTPLPRLGTVANAAATDSEASAAHLAALGLHHIRVDFYVDQPQPFAAGLQRVKAANSALLAVLHLTENAEAETTAFLAQLRQHEVAVAAVLLLTENSLTTNTTALQAVLKTLKATLPNTDFGAGTDFNFTEFNRNRFDAKGFDFVAFSLHPQEHAFDHLSLVENAEAQGDVVRSAQAIFPKKPVWVSPVTLRRRFNPYAHDPAVRIASNEQRSDPRQASLWAAGWSLASLKYLAEAGAETVTYFQDLGNQGLMAEDGRLVFPVYLLLKEVQTHAGGEVLATETSQLLAVSSLLLRKSGFLKLLLANHGPNPVRLRLPLELQSLTFKLLEETSLLEATTNPKAFANSAGNTLTLAAQADVLTLPPFALAIS